MNQLITLATSKTLYSIFLTSCVIDVARKEFTGDTLILHGEMDTEGAEAAGHIAQQLSETQFKVIIFATISTLKITHHPFLVPAHHIVWIVDPANFPNQVDNIKKNILWDSRAKLIVIFQNEKINIEYIFSTLWLQTRAVNIIALSSNMTFYTWFPFKTTTCNKNITAVKVAYCSEGELNTQDDMFPIKISNSLNNCLLYAATSMVYPYVGKDPKTGAIKNGIEVNIVNTFLDKYNATIEYLGLLPGEPFYLYTLSENLTGAARLLANNEADLAFGSMFQSFQHSAYAEPLQLPHSSDELIWFIPQPEIMPPVKNLYRAFEIDVWLSVAVASILITTTMHLVTITIKLINVENRPPELSLLLLNSLAITLNYSVPMPRTLLLRSFLMISFYYGLHVVTAYQSSLISFLTKPIMEKPFSSVQEAVNDGLIPYMYEPHKPYILQDGFPDQKLILKEDRHVFRAEMNFPSMKTFKDKLILGVRSTTLFYLTWQKIVDEQNRLLVRTMVPGVLSFFVTIIMSRGNPLKEKLDQTVVQLIESGLKDKWMHDLVSKNERLDFNSLDGNSPLTLENLTGAFYILLLGSCAAFIVFATEFCYEYIVKITSKNHTNTTYPSRIRINRGNYAYFNK